MTQKLLPCPFCGNEAEFERIGTHRASCIVACTMCGATVESGEVGEMCGRKWNDRAIQPVPSLTEIEHRIAANIADALDDHATVLQKCLQHLSAEDRTRAQAKIQELRVQAISIRHRYRLEK